MFGPFHLHSRSLNLWNFQAKFEEFDFVVVSGNINIVENSTVWYN